MSQLIPNGYVGASSPTITNQMSATLTADDWTMVVKNERYTARMMVPEGKQKIGTFISITPSTFQGGKITCECHETYVDLILTKTTETAINDSFPPQTFYMVYYVLLDGGYDIVIPNSYGVDGYSNVFQVTFETSSGDRTAKYIADNLFGVADDYMEIQVDEATKRHTLVLVPPRKSDGTRDYDHTYILTSVGPDHSTLGNSGVRWVKLDDIKQEILADE